jgi:hypothetical protein
MALTKQAVVRRFNEGPEVLSDRDLSGLDEMRAGLRPSWSGMPLTWWLQADGPVFRTAFRCGGRYET